MRKAKIISLTLLTFLCIWLVSYYAGGYMMDEYKMANTFLGLLVFIVVVIVLGVIYGIINELIKK